MKLCKIVLVLFHNKNYRKSWHFLLQDYIHGTPTYLKLKSSSRGLGVWGFCSELEQWSSGQRSLMFVLGSVHSTKSSDEHMGLPRPRLLTLSSFCPYFFSFSSSFFQTLQSRRIATFVTSAFFFCCMSTNTCLVDLLQYISIGGVLHFALMFLHTIASCAGLVQ